MPDVARLPAEETALDRLRGLQAEQQRVGSLLAEKHKSVASATSRIRELEGVIEAEKTASANYADAMRAEYSGEEHDALAAVQAWSAARTAAESASAEIAVLRETRIALEQACAGPASEMQSLASELHAAHYFAIKDEITDKAEKYLAMLRNAADIYTELAALGRAADQFANVMERRMPFLPAVGINVAVWGPFLNNFPALENKTVIGVTEADIKKELPHTLERLRALGLSIKSELKP
jgi:hypothetical protein